MGAAGRLYSQRNVYRVTVQPGDVSFVDIEIPMQRAGRRKSFVKERGLPVTCLIAPTSHGDLHVSAVETSHTFHKLRARLRVSADRGAQPRSVRSSIGFTIDGQSGWPPATLVVTVRR